MKFVLSIITVFLLTASCKSSHNAEHSMTPVRITGDLSNLPNGKVYLISIPDRKTILDSTSSTSGKFTFSFVPNQKDLNSEVSIIHKDNLGVTREFSFATNKLYNGQPNFYESFLLEDGLKIFGKIVDFKPALFKLPANLKLIEVTTPLTGGKQTWVLYNITPIFPASQFDTTGFNELNGLIKKYPYSYYLLNEVNRNITKLSSQQLKILISSFDKNLTESPEWLKLKKLSSSGFSNNKSIWDIKDLVTIDNKKEFLIQKTNNGRYKLLVFWASWCQPCLQEIPALENIYNLNREKLSITSISLDKNFDDWKLMLGKKKLPWRQLIISNETQKASILYQLRLNGAIPALVLIDPHGNIVKTRIGYDSSKNLTDFINQYVK